MHRRLIVMRHARAAAALGDDHARPLDDRGRREAPDVAHELVRAGWRPELVLSSDAWRTRQTWAHMAPIFPGPVHVEYLHGLYRNGVDVAAEQLAELPSHVQTVLVLGHNPAQEVLVHVLSGSTVRLSTAHAALLTRDAPTWREAMRGARTWRLAGTLAPSPEE